MTDKINFQKVFQNEVEILKKQNFKPKLLLHVCCGPCFTLPYEELKDYFDITIIYNNSNIYPKEEYERRLSELKQYILNHKFGIEVIEIPYDNLAYNKYLEPYKDYPEGSKRCEMCFLKRLSFGYQYASEHHFDYFGTVMTISRYKNSQVINHIGEELQKKYPNVKWLFADFKKNDGYNKSLQIVRDNNMYFQTYCGCIFSYKIAQEKHKKI